MLLSKSITNKIRKDNAWLILFFVPLLISCSNKTNVVEIITAPIFPNDFSNIPNETIDPNLQSLTKVNELLSKERLGRKDPFLPANLNFDDNQLLVPESFEYKGQIKLNDVVNAFVSYKERTGTIETGDIGGKSTDLLPTGWLVEKVEVESQVLTLSFENNSVDIDLFPKSGKEK